MKVENSRPRCNYCCGCNFNEAWRKFNLHFWLKIQNVEQFFNNFAAKKYLATLPRNLYSFKSALFTENISRSHLNDKTAIKLSQLFPVEIFDFQLGGNANVGLPETGPKVQPAGQFYGATKNIA